MTAFGYNSLMIPGYLTAISTVNASTGSPSSASCNAFLIASSDSLTVGLYVLALFVLIQQAEGTLLVPLLMRLTTSVHPAAVLISLLVGAKIFGFVGIVLAVPLTVMIQELVDSWANEKNRKKISV